MATVRAGLRAVLSTPSLRRLELAWLVSATSGWAFMVALAIYAYDQGGTAAVGLAALARMAPAAVAAPFADLLGDRHSRRNVLVAACLARAAVLGAIGATIAAGAPLAVTLVLAALFTAIQTAHKPEQAASPPSLSWSATRSSRSPGGPCSSAWRATTSSRARSRSSRAPTGWRRGSARCSLRRWLRRSASAARSSAPARPSRSR